MIARLQDRRVAPCKKTAKRRAHCGWISLILSPSVFEHSPR